MAVQTRKRSYSTPRVSGTTRMRDGDRIYTDWGSPVFTYNTGTCEDVIGNYGGNNPLFLTSHTQDDVLLNGQYGYYEYKNYPVYPSTIAGPGVPPSWNPKLKSASKAAADTHPGEPQISLPNFLFELKDLPGMLKHLAEKTGKKHPKAPPKSLSDDYLAYTFGWAPFVGDILAVAGVADWCKSRATMLDRAKREGHVKRRGTLGSDSTKWTDTNVPYFGPTGTFGIGSGSCTVEGWVTTHWTHNGQLPLASMLQGQGQQMIAAALGLQIGFDVMWNAMPWSWLVDYFTDLSSIISVHQNRAGFQYAGGCQMKRYEVAYTVSPKPPLPLKGMSPVTQRSTFKTRFPLEITPINVGLNFLHARQLATLTALTVSRSGSTSKRSF